MKYKNNSVSITSWALEDQPREKMISYGKNSLTDAELLAIIIGSGSKHFNAFELSKQILASRENNLANFHDIKWADLIEFSGIGKTKAINIIASLELGKRINQAEANRNPKLKTSGDAYYILKNILSGLPHEEFWILLLNRSNTIISKERISIGGVSSVMVDPKIIFSKALDRLASSIILAHNHPSGNLRPSEADISLTTKIINAGSYLDINVLDHIIVSDNGFFSFSDEGMLK